MFHASHAGTDTGLRREAFEVARRTAGRWHVLLHAARLSPKPGVGLDFVRKPEYGRLRWPAYPAGTNNDRLISMRDGGIVALPQLTDEQRAAALEKAAAARRARAELRIGSSVAAPTSPRSSRTRRAMKSWAK